MEPIRLKSFVNQRVLIKTKGKPAYETTVIAVENGGYWTRDGRIRRVYSFPRDSMDRYGRFPVHHA